MICTNKIFIIYLFMSDFDFQNQEIITGSSRLVSKNKKFDRIKYATDHMDHNLAYTKFLKLNKVKDNDGRILRNFKKIFLDYRNNWNTIPESNYNLNTLDYNDPNLDFLGPLCVDIELAAICDLACPHCFRDYILTPDKIMNFNLYKKIIDQIKVLTYRQQNLIDEPLLNSKIDKYIEQIKGYLEVQLI